MIGLNELQSKLDPNQGVLEYFLGEEYVYSFLITRDSSYVNRAAFIPVGDMSPIQLVNA